MNDLDPLLHEAMARVRGPVDSHPSLTDVRRRARRHNRRRMTATVGAVACTGVATAALIVRRDTESSRITTSGQPDSPDAFGTTGPPTTIYLSAPGATSTVPMTPRPIDPSFVWEVLSQLQGDPSAAGLVYPADTANVDVMPSAEMFGCATEECGAMFNYIVWHEIASALGFYNVLQMRDMNSGIDFGHPPREGDVLQTVYSLSGPATTSLTGDTTTTMSLYEGVTLIDGGAPAGAMEDAYQRLTGYNRTIVPGSGRTVEQTMVMPIGNNTSIATAVGVVFGIDGFDTWDPSLVTAPVEGLAAVVIGPDYWDRVQNTTATTTTTTTTPPAP